MEINEMFNGMDMLVAEMMDAIENGKETAKELEKAFFENIAGLEEYGVEIEYLNSRGLSDWEEKYHDYVRMVRASMR